MLTKNVKTNLNNLLLIVAFVQLYIGNDEEAQLTCYFPGEFVGSNAAVNWNRDFLIYNQAKDDDNSRKHQERRILRIEKNLISNETLS